MNKYELNAVAKAVLGPVIIAAAMFWIAGTLHWAWGWAMNGLHLAMWIVNTVAVTTLNRELLAERGKRRADTQAWDKVVLGLFGLVWLVELVIASLDVRYGWTPAFPLAARAFGAVLVVCGFSLVTWAMVANRHFEPGVRVQRDREHSVVSTGPYRFVRHPGYTGTIAAYFIGMPCMLGSQPSLIAAATGIAVIVLRTAKEDAFLMRELAAYASYADRVRYRLLPNIY